ncbi:hypothetical protein Tco_0907710 [Tanacetum coccineum]|uniref:Uncharacterized protein n=1 Tax=Tanacetum coccineum TaxID=301880 RepID=A0ABQ5CK31_9ASTR
MHDSKTFNNVFYALKEDLIYATEFKIQEMVQHKVSNRFKIPLVELEEYSASPREILLGSLELLVLLQVASPSTCLWPPLW